MNAIPFTAKVEKLSQISVSPAIETALKNDMVSVLDSKCAAEFKLSGVSAICTATDATTFDTDGTPSTQAVTNLSDKNLRDIVDYLKKGNVPRYDGMNYIGILSTNAVRGLYDYFESKANYTSMQHAIEGEIGTYYGCRINKAA